MPKDKFPSLENKFTKFFKPLSTLILPKIGQLSIFGKINAIEKDFLQKIDTCPIFVN
jgi:hypothetical protein